MARYIALSRKEHQQMGWKQSEGLHFTSGDMTVPLLLQEIPRAVTTMPMVFAQPERGRYELCVLLSPERGRNLFVSRDGRWLTGYIPAAYRSYPFRVMRRSEEDTAALCFNTDSGLLLEQTDDPVRRFFDDSGELAEPMRRLVQFLEQCEQGRIRTERATGMLVRHGLLRPLNEAVKLDNERARAMDGLYCIDESALKRLSGEALAELRDADALMLAYGQLMSLHRMDNFEKLYRLQALPLTDDAAGLGDIFSNQDDDMLKFD
jgi:hypothetical protein